MANETGPWAPTRAALRAGRPDEAERLCRTALAADPNDADGWFVMGLACQSQGRPSDAAESYRRALELQPDLPEAHHRLGDALFDLGQPAQAEASYLRALRMRPDDAEVFNALGIAIGRQGRRDEAIECYTQALSVRPEFADAHNNLGIARRFQGRLAEAEGHFRQALAAAPGFADAHHNLGVVLRDQARPEEAADSFRQTLALRPDYVAARDGLLMVLHYRAGVTPQELFAAHAEYQERHAAPLRAQWRPHANDRDPNRPLRLGFVSGDFGRHPVGYLLVRGAEALARRPVTVVYYSDRRAAPDDLTARFRLAAHTWRVTTGVSHEQLAEQVRTDAIDVLIDLAGHTAGNRLLMFARKPAPVQCTWLGYPNTTGLDAIDYLIADVQQVPSGAEQFYRERVLRLPGGYASYEPPADVPESGPPPSVASGRVTFGCFNNPAKLSPPALAAFADVLRRVPDSRLLLKYRGLDDTAVTGRLRDQLAAAGANSDRVEVLGGTAQAAHLAAYGEVDIALDTFPYGGGVTTCDALWMGVPVVTLPGETFASRHGLSHLAAIGLAEELAARNVEDYAARAAALALDQARLTALRAELRGRMMRSPLCDGERLADELLTALRQAWRNWVGGH